MGGGCPVKQITLFDRGHRLASQPGEGVDLFFHGEPLGREFPVLDGVPITSRSSATGTVHPADAIAPHRRRSAL
jgi:hypothetical protein